MISEKEIRKYGGMPYRDDFDCADFAVHLVRDFFGWPVSLPSERPRGVGSQNALHDMSKAYGIRTDSPADGDFVLMFDQGATIPTHGGVYMVVDGQPSVFHNAKGAGGSVLHPIRKLSKLGLRIEGYYKWAY